MNLNFLHLDKSWSTRDKIIVWLIIWALLFVILFVPTFAWAQAWQPPYCTGANAALQYGPNGWICATISGTQGPAGPQGPQGPPGAGVPAAPLPTECITSHWNGTAWTCVPTEYLTAK